MASPYLRFTTELSQELGRRPGVPFDDAHQTVFDRWILDQRYDDLVSYLLENFDGAKGGEIWFRRLAEALIRGRQESLIHRLYGSLIQQRQAAYFTAKNHLMWHDAPPLLASVFAQLLPFRRKLSKQKELALAVMRDYRGFVAQCQPSASAAIDVEIQRFSDERRRPDKASGNLN